MRIITKSLFLQLNVLFFLGIAHANQVTIPTEFNRIQIKSSSYFGEIDYVDLKWNPVAGAEKYEFQASTDPQFAFLNLEREVSKTSIKFSYRASDVVIYWRVRPKVDDKKGSWSDVSSVSIRYKRPLSSPAGISPAWNAKVNMSSPQTNSINMSWSSVPNASQYVLQLSSNKDFARFKEYVTEDNSTVVDNPMMTGTIYWRIKALGTPRVDQQAGFKPPVLNKEIEAEFVVRDFWGKGTKIPYILESAWSPAYAFSINEDYRVVKVFSPLPNRIYYYDPPATPKIKFQWEPRDDEDSYRLQLSEDAEFSKIILDEEVDDYFYDWVNIPIQKSDFFWRVKVSKPKRDDFWKWSDARKVTVAANLPTPKLFYPVMGDTVNSFRKDPVIHLQFTRVERAEAYDIQLASEAQFKTGLLEEGQIEGKQRTIYITYKTQKQVPIGKVFWRVRSRVGGVPSAWSETSNFIFSQGVSTKFPLASSPEKGQSFKFDLLKEAKIDFVWKKQLEGTSQIQVASDVDFTNLLLDKVTDQERLDRQTLVVGGGPMFWRLRTKTGDVLSEWSPVWEFEIERNFPPIDLIEPADNLSIQRQAHMEDTQLFSWKAIPYVDSYDLQISQDPKFGELFLSKEKLVKSQFHFQGYLPNGKLYWKVRAEKGGAKSDWSKTRVLDNNKTLDRPRLISPRDSITNMFGSSDVDVEYEWSKVPEAASYQLQVSSKVDFSAVIIDISNIEVTKKVVTKQYAEANYYWRVRSYVKGTFSPWTTPSVFTTKRVLNFPQPQIIGPFDGYSVLVGINDQKGIGKFSWHPIQGAKQYRIEFARDMDFKEIVYSEVSLSESYEPSKKIPLGLLAWRVRAEHYDAYSPWSSPRKIILKLPLVFAMKSSQRYYYTGNKDIAEVTLTWGEYRPDTTFRIEVAKDSKFNNIVKHFNSQGVKASVILPPEGKYYWRVFATTDVAKNADINSVDKYSVTSDVEWFSITRQENLKFFLSYGYEQVNIKQDVSTQSANVRDGEAEGTGLGTFHADFEYWFYGKEKEWGLITEINFSNPTVTFTPTTTFNADDISDYTMLRAGALLARRLTYGSDVKVILSGGLKRANRYLIRRENNIFVADAFKEFYFAQELGLEYYFLNGRYFTEGSLEFIERVDNLDTWSMIPTIQGGYRYEWMSYGAKFQVFDQTLQFEYVDNVNNRNETAEVRTTSYSLLFQVGFHY